MRAVSLSNERVREQVTQSFVPLKVRIDHGTEEFPLDWPALKSWSTTYRRMGGKKCEGITACCVISPDLKIEYANTGSAFVWEMFESTAYDPVKFAAMLERGKERFKRDRQILEDGSLSERERLQKRVAFQNEVRKALEKEGPFRLPPTGFTIQHALELFRLSGDVK